MPPATAGRAAHEHRRGARPSCARTSPTSPSRSCGSWRPRGSSSRSARRRATASTPRPTSAGCGSCWPRSATSTCRCGSSATSSPRSTGASRPASRAGGPAPALPPTAPVAVEPARPRPMTTAATAPLDGGRTGRARMTGLDPHAVRAVRAVRPGRGRPRRPRGARPAGAAPSGWYDADALVVATVAAQLAEYGLTARHLRAYRAAADREVGLFTQLITPLAACVHGRRPGPGPPRRCANCRLTGAQLHAALVRRGLRSLWARDACRYVAGRTAAPLTGWRERCVGTVQLGCPCACTVRERVRTTRRRRLRCAS